MHRPTKSCTPPAHIATRSLEIGDANLKTERGQRVELGIHTHSERLDFSASVYQTRFKDFIYLADTGVTEGLPVRAWTQQDAVFRGAEAEALVHLFEVAPVTGICACSVTT